MNNPDKILHYLGYNSLGIMMDQDRRHWLLRVDKNKTIQDVATGSMFKGTVDNAASDIVIETQKLSQTSNWFNNMKFQNEELSYILEPSASAFTFSISVNGLMFTRIKSTNYPTSDSITDPVHRVYRMELKNCTECIIAFGADNSSSDVYAGRWLRTTTPPTIQAMDGNGNYTINVSARMNGCTNPVFYYPLDPNIQPFPLTYDNGIYTTAAVDNDNYIGLPLYWYTCDESNIGPSVSITNNTSNQNQTIFILGNPGDEPEYAVKAYVGVDGNNNATPDTSSTQYYKIICHPLLPNSFTNTADDFILYLDNTITFKNTDSDIEYPVTFVFGPHQASTLTMVNTVNWTYVDDNTYEIDMDDFDTNCLNLNNNNPLIPILNVNLDRFISFTEPDDANVGFAGISMGSSNNNSEQYPKYPHDLNNWDGLPEWINNLDPDSVPAHMMMYAIHNTPGYSPAVPDSRQTAAIILDPGKKKTSPTEGFANDERGRAYLLSNDDTQYRNNAVEAATEGGMVKPARTIARICDIPSSVMQLVGVSGLSPDPVVDKKYVRSYASYSDEDKQRLWNVVNAYDRWVRPTAKDEYNHPITEQSNQYGDFVFSDDSLLRMVDMYTYNNFNIMENLNSSVDPTKVHVSSIIDPGENYNFHDAGKIIIGGFAFTYEVQEVDENGGVVELTIAGDSAEPINLSNFDMLDGPSGLTDVYGTAPLDPSNSGTGLKVRLIIEGYVDLLPTKGRFLDGIHAFVKCSDGIWLYEFKEVYNGHYEWVSTLLISPFEKSSTASDEGLSTPDAYMTSIISRYRTITVQPWAQSQNQQRVGVTAMITSTFINIIDEGKTPLTPNSSSGQDDESTLRRVDLCSWRCDRIIHGVNTSVKTFEGVLTKLKEDGVLQYDCYVAWQWVNDEDPRNTLFNYGIITRSMNNYVTTDVTTTLPGNDLRYKSYVHTNPSTTVVWDAPGVSGVMMWVYDPSSTMVEKYIVDPETQDLYADRDYVDWNTIMLDGSEIITDDKFNWNIMTNNPVALHISHPGSNEPIYQQPEFVNIINKGDVFSMKKTRPVGNWKLVFPRCESFRLRNVTDGTTFKPVRLQMIRGENLPSFGDVIDENGNTVNAKTLILNSSSDGVSLNAYNSQTGTWEKI